MKSKNALFISIADECQMASLGAFLGKYLFNPIIADGEKLVVSAYGPRNTGKTTLFKAAREASLGTPNTGQLVPTAFFDNDFGRNTYPSRIRYEDVVHTHGVPVVESRHQRTKVYFFEHPPLPHLATTDVLCLISVRNDSSAQQIYYEDMPALLWHETVRMDAPKDHARKIYAAVDQMRLASKEFCGTGETSQTRDVRLYLMSENPGVKTAFRKMRSTARRTFATYDRT